MVGSAASNATVNSPQPKGDTAMTITHSGGTRRDRRRQATADALTLATRELVAAEGIGVSVQAIADRADVALTTLYNHFESKDALLRAAAIRALFEFERDVNARMSEIAEPIERVCARTRLFLRMAATHRQTAQFLSRLPLEVTATQDLHSAQAETEVRAAMKARQLKCDNLEVAHLVVNATAARFTAMRLQDDAISDRHADALALELMQFLGMPKQTASRIVRKTLPAAS